jgi:cytochrome b
MDRGCRDRDSDPAQPPLDRKEFSMSDPRTRLVHDWPTRLFHWMFAGFFLATFSIANFAEHSRVFPLHMLAGLMLAALVVFRLLWGVVGTRYARFDSFALHPARLAEYFRAIFGGGGKKWLGHNPASSWAALLMLGLAAGLAITGLLMASGRDREVYEDLHELLANAFFALVILHIAGIILHSLRHRDGFAKSMLDGHKQGATDAPAIAHSRPVAGIVLLGSLAAFGVYLLRGHDPVSGTLAVFGTTLQLGEAEGGENLARERRHSVQEGEDED